MQAVALDPAGPDACTVLERGDVLVVPQGLFHIAPAEREFLLQVRPSKGHYHKNISYRPAGDRLAGFGSMDADSAGKLHAILRNYSRAIVDSVGTLLPRYRSQWTLDYASLRPVEEAGRDLPLLKRNDLLHTDAFPTRPTRGGLILRVFTNVHPSKTRVWVTSDPFETPAARYAAEAGLARIARSPLHPLRRGLASLGLPLRARSRYDEFMLRFHDYLKQNEDYQRDCPKYRLEFPPGATWLVFTDMVPHSVESGQLALEQTFIVPPGALAAPARAPIAILEKLAGVPLSN